MATRTPVRVNFPFRGLNQHHSFEDQPPLTSPDLLNVRGYDPKTGRLRGAQRPGHTKHNSTQIGQLGEIQGIHHITYATRKVTGTLQFHDYTDFEFETGEPFQIGSSCDDPPVKTGLFAHYDASRLAFAHGDAVGTWPDLSGNERDLLQTTGSKKPTFDTDSNEKLAVLDFDRAASQGMETAAFASDVNLPITVYFVGQTAFTGTNDYTAFGHGVLSANRPNLTALGSPVDLWDYAGVQAGSPDTNPHLIGVFFKASGTNDVLRIDRQIIGDSDSGNTGGFDGISVGVNASGSAPWDGYIGEVLFYSRTLSNEETAVIESYLGAKWGI